MQSSIPFLTESQTETKSSPRAEVSDAELLQVIADFLDMGYVENIVALFRQEPRYYDWTARLLADERLTVRLGVSVLFEYLVELAPEQVHRAVPVLVEQLTHPIDQIRGEAASVLGIIATAEALEALRPLVHDPSSQVAEVARDILGLVTDK